MTLSRAECIALIRSYTKEPHEAHAPILNALAAWAVLIDEAVLDVQHRLAGLDYLIHARTDHLA